MAVALAQYLKYSLCTTGDNILLSDELKQIESYFNMLKIKYEDAFTYSITAKKEIDMLRIPSHILFSIFRPGSLTDHSKYWTP